jgi:predicted  nucleic acid-binding Zn-ribbon protein
MHDVVIVGVPLIAILGGIFFNNQALGRVETRLDGRLDRLENNLKDFRGEIRDVRGEIKDLRGEMTSLRSEMHREFEQFYRTLGQHDARLDNLRSDG